MGLFKKKAKTYSYDKERMKPVIKTSICTGEQVAGFKDIHTGKIEDIMLVKTAADIERSKNTFHNHCCNNMVCPFYHSVSYNK